MVFGVALSYGIRNSPTMIPPLLVKCFDAIEARGIFTVTFQDWIPRASIESVQKRPT
jgi:hypothetical protein